MEKNTQLPVEVVNEINEQADKYGFVVPYDGSNKFYNDDKVEGYKAGATVYATKLHQLDEHFKVMSISCDAQLEKIQQLQQENASLKDWKHSALAILNPLWDYADKHLNVPLGEIKTEAMIKRIKELEHQNDKLKEKATGWRPLLEKLLVMNEMWGDLPGEYINEVKKYLYGE